jgi:hypothetical protein|tara:strand:+ start:3491 stop:3982 length:492 start_codon:yes stop_codon:yes gene_type:complete
MGEEKQSIGKKTLELWEKYVDWLDDFSKHIDHPSKIRNLIVNNGKKIILWIYLITTVSTLIGVYSQGECLNCEPLTKEEGLAILNDRDKTINYVNEHIYVPFTSFKTYLHYVKFPLISTWIVNLVLISVVIIFFNIIKRIIIKLGLRNDPTIKIPKIKRNEQS